VAHAGIEHAGVMRMQSRGGEQAIRMLRMQVEGRARALEAAAGDDHALHAGHRGPLQHLLQVVLKALVRKVHADVDQLHARNASRSASTDSAGWSHDTTKRAASSRGAPQS